MTLAEKGRQIEEAYAFLPDPQERFQYLVELSSADSGLPPEERSDVHRVVGCVSKVWLLGEARAGRWHFRSDADSPIVKALAWLLCDFYNGAETAEILQTDPTFVDTLRLREALTENRRRGFDALLAHLRRILSASNPP